MHWYELESAQTDSGRCSAIGVCFRRLRSVLGNRSMVLNGCMPTMPVGERFEQNSHSGTRYHYLFVNWYEFTNR